MSDLRDGESNHRKEEGGERASHVVQRIALGARAPVAWDRVRAPMPPVPRQIPRFCAEPPQEPIPYGRWGDALAEHFLSAAQEALPTDPEDAGGADHEIGPVIWFPDRTWNGRTYFPATAAAGDGGEVFGYVSYRRDHEGAQATDFEAKADYTDETAAQNPDWTLDLSDFEIGHWRGTEGRRGIVTLVWGVAMVANGAAVTVELGPDTTDQCDLIDERFTLISLDAYTGDYIEVRLYGARGAELARESLYEDD